MTDQFFTDARVTGAVSPSVVAFLEANQPNPDTSLDFQIGHWMGVTAAALDTIRSTHSELAQANQRIRELEADL